MPFPKRSSVGTPKATDARIAAPHDPSSIGNILLKMGVITEGQLKEAIGQKAQFDEALLGSLLWQMGYVSHKDMAIAMKIQNELREGSALTAELDVLQLKMDESASRTRQLASCISKARMRRAPRSSQAEVFVIPTDALARAGG